MDGIQLLSGRALDDLCAAYDVRRKGEPFKVRPLWAWQDLWIGAYWDRDHRRLYVMLLPTLGFVVQLSTLESDGSLRARAASVLRGPF